MPFEGFPTGKTRLTPIPEPFFTELLEEVDDLVELKIILYAFWYINRQEKDMQYLTDEDFSRDEILLKSLSPNPENSLVEGLMRAVQHNVLLQVHFEGQNIYLLNTAHGRATVKALHKGSWKPGFTVRPDPSLGEERPNIFQLYEENIGPLTPLMADTLEDAEDTYPQTWIADAIKIAVEKNIRNWRYIDAILKSWQKEGRSEKDRRDTQENRRKYIEGDYGDIIEH